MAARANTRGKGPIPYGAAVRTDPLYDDPAYQKAILDYCQVIVGEGGLKWIDLRPDRHIFDFTQPDRQLAFAEAHGLEMRGHTLAWHGAMPDWTETIASAEEARDELVSHIHTVVGRYKGRIPSWDVCNEPIADTPTRDAPLRDSMWHRNLGRDYIELALRTTAAADPDARLVINEYNFEQATDESRARRKAFLDLLRDLKARGAPLHAVGIQGHIRSDTALDRSGLTAFIAEIDAMGLGVLVTELDVIDKSLPGPEVERDAAVAKIAEEFLDAIGAACRPEAVLTWGISDRFTWVPIWFTRDDGLPNRPLPLNADYQPKPMMQVIQDFTHSFG
jgi:endo-1,4-beta-xylanase